jgi:glutamate/tyrosine decarboxylase-like PLP-dependent enzyme
MLGMADGLMTDGLRINSSATLDPRDWAGLKADGHKMLDDMFDYLENIRQRPVWKPTPDKTRARFRAALPRSANDLAIVHDEFMQHVLPFTTGNTHPAFMGWVHGGGSAVGMLADMLAAGINANLGGRDHAPIEVERQVVRWMCELFRFPDSASGLFVTGTSMANLLAVLIARTSAVGPKIRGQGVRADRHRLVAYTSSAAHGCVARAMDLSGLGTDALRVIPTNKFHQMDTGALRAAIVEDRESGHTPFLLVGSAGTVDIGAIDDLEELAAIARAESIFLHVDGAFGALGILSAEIAPRLRGIEQADSIAFDFHKWLQVPYDAGFLLVKDGALHRDTFASPAAYLRRETRGLAGGDWWPCDMGADLSRGFRALKVWFTLKVFGIEALGEMIDRTCALARYLERRILDSRDFELLAPVQLNIVCFRYRCANADSINAQIVADLQEAGIAAPSTTTICGRLAIRAAVVNHRTNLEDIDNLLSAAAAYGAQRSRRYA